MAKFLTLALLVLFCPIEASAGGKTISDAFGRKVEIPSEVRRVVALGSSMAFITYLEGQDLVVGVEDIDKTDAAKPYVMLNRERFNNLPVVGKAGAVRIPNYEQIVSLKPDVVFILSVDGSEPDLLQRKLRIPVVAVSQGFPAFDQDVFINSIRLTGEVLNRQERAETLVRGIAALNGQLNYSPAPGEQAIAYVGGLSYKGNQGINSTAGNFFPLRLARIANLADSTGREGHQFVSKEFLIASNPPLIFIDGNGLPLIREGIRDDHEYFERLKALKNGNAWLLLPHTSYFNNPEILYINAFFMAKAAYPEHYAKMDPEAWADKIFILFNGSPMYKQFTEKTGAFGRMVLSEGNLEYAK